MANGNKRRRRRQRLRERRMLEQRLAPLRRKRVDPVVAERQLMDREIRELIIEDLRHRGVAIIGGEAVSSRSINCVAKRPRSAATRDLRNRTLLSGGFTPTVSVAPKAPGMSVEEFQTVRAPQQLDEPISLLDAVGHSPRRIEVVEVVRDATGGVVKDKDGNVQTKSTREFIQSSAHVARVQDNGRGTIAAPLELSDGGIQGLRGTLPKSRIPAPKS